MATFLVLTSAVVDVWLPFACFAVRRGGQVEERGSCRRRRTDAQATWGGWLGGRMGGLRDGRAAAVRQENTWEP
jgi:hypothetical protein